MWRVVKKISSQKKSGRSDIFSKFTIWGLGSKNLIFHLRGSKILTYFSQGGSKFLSRNFNSTTPLLLGYKWPTPKSLKVLRCKVLRMDHSLRFCWIDFWVALIKFLITKHYSVPNIINFPLRNYLHFCYSKYPRISIIPLYLSAKFSKILYSLVLEVFSFCNIVRYDFKVKWCQ